MIFEEQFKEYDFPRLGLIRLPEISIDSKYKKQVGLKEDASNFDFLCALTKRGFDLNKHRLPKEKWDNYFERANNELVIFDDLGFTDYCLLVWLVVNKMRELGAFVDFGRGSVAGSFVFALLGVSGVLDVIDKGLFFERFVSRARSKKTVIDGVTYLQGDLLPDVDLNLGGIRNEIVAWLNDIYKGKICKIITTSTFSGKILVKDVYKTMNDASESEAQSLANLVEKHFGVAEDLKTIPEKNKKFKEWTEKYPETFKVCLKLRDLIRHRGCHASGYFISKENLDNTVPLELTKDKEPALGFAMDDASKLGIKLDLLGLTQNVILKEFFKDIDEKLEDIDLDNNPEVYNHFLAEDLLPYGLYQINAKCMLGVVRKIKPRNLLELSDANAIARPGALDYLEEYANNSAQCPHPLFENIVKSTRNLFLYQEQLLQALVVIGFTVDEAEICRRIIGKKKLEDVAGWEQKIYNKIKEKRLPQEIGGILWKVLNESAKYSFNRSHSVSTAKLGALTVYAKYKYPLQFYKACLNSVNESPDPIEEINQIVKELPKFNIQLLPPNIFKSSSKFTIEENNIRFALSAIKGVTEATIKKIENFKHEFSNKFEIFEASEEAGINSTVLKHLIMVGALDNEPFKASRPKLIFELELWKELTDREKKYVLELGQQFEYDLGKIIYHLRTEKRDIKGTNFIIKESRHLTLKNKLAPALSLYNTKTNLEFDKWGAERALLGFSYSSSLYDIFSKRDSGLTLISAISLAEDSEEIKFVGEVIDVKTGITKERELPFLTLYIQDNTGHITARAFNGEKTQTIDNIKELNGRLPCVDDIVIITGRKKENTVFISKCGIQKLKWTERKPRIENKSK